MSLSMSSTGPGAPPWSGPFIAPIAPVTALTISERVLAITRAVNVEAFMPWSITVTQYVSSARTATGSGSLPSTM